MTSPAERHRSRLSPLRGNGWPHIPMSGAPAERQRSTNGQSVHQPTRTYRACAYCRQRKAKCDLGDVNAPHSPPCTRCLREQRDCVFLPSKRPHKSTPKVWAARTTHRPGTEMQGFDWPEPHGDAIFPHPPVLPQSRSQSLGIEVDNNEASETRRLVAANFSNESDALEILASVTTMRGVGGARHGENGTISRDELDVDRTFRRFPLVAQGILDEAMLANLVAAYFANHHRFLPIITPNDVPSTRAELALLIKRDPFLVAALVTISSRYNPLLLDVHRKAWHIVQKSVTDYSICGFKPTLGLVMGMLLLADNVPAADGPPDEASMQLFGMNEAREGWTELHGTETRRFWAYAGTAVRAAYGLGLDELPSGSESTASRSRLAWTWCQIFDRWVGLRAGHASWARGTTSLSGPASYPLPSSSTPSPWRDSCQITVSLGELTQIALNAHDLLYPSATRTRSLVDGKDYTKYLDQFHLALKAFEGNWRDVRWQDKALEELTWCSYHFVSLYVTSFAFQAFVQESGQSKQAGTSRLMRSVVSSPDALYIFQSIDSAREILNINLRLKDLGVLGYVPSRYLTNFAYAGTFALKAAVSGLMGQDDKINMLGLVGSVCSALVSSAPDKDHTAARYGQMLKMLSTKLDNLPDADAVNDNSRLAEPQANAPPPVAPQLAQNSNGNIFLNTTLDDDNFLDRFLTEPQDIMLDLNLGTEWNFDDYPFGTGDGTNMM